MNLTRLKRFDKSKHEQLVGLLQWCELMGLTGRDLISLGGHIDRLQTREAAQKNIEIAKGYKIDRVGHDTSNDARFSLKTVNGRYQFQYYSYQTVYVTSYKTKVKKHLAMDHFNLGRMDYRKAWIYRVLLNVHSGKIVLDF